MGDFNVYGIAEEKSGAKANFSKCVEFNDFLNKCGFHDLGFVGPIFTWSWGFVNEWLDRDIYNNL